MFTWDGIERALNTDAAPLIIIGAVIVFCTALSMIGKTVRAASRERTRREIAAYIAEGSMTPEQGERLMNAGTGKQC